MDWIRTNSAKSKCKSGDSKSKDYLDAAYIISYLPSEVRLEHNTYIINNIIWVGVYLLGASLLR